ncbi:NitT/TauT family transport system permease protein/sulfonate transport system permease protein [Nocardia neocaledoniensis]|uniref:NitT/TauT family transport system permease protein/sulfonate transport system permease protein n=2 Tax=Nocardia neocaledoniensis TaxID=236511 RepID=A0A317NJ43_9NOCA|nr:ABC transporter permease [Nocardia neocaledoniensis]PWV75140.1 NitT/TauT family transport system permease protein/sulfonate transport system permease protein [Nocardia neocaledoniensis]
MTSTVRTADPPAATPRERPPAPGRRRVPAWISRAGSLGWTVAGLALAALAWTLLAASGRFPDALLPGLPEILGAAGDLRREGLLAEDILASLRRALGGFVLGAATGLGAAIVTATTTLGRRLLRPVLRLLAPVPTIGLVPLAILWFGLGEGSKALVIALGVFVPVWINSHVGLASTPRDYLRAARCLGAGRAQTLREIVLPEAAPDIVAGLRVGAAMAFVLIVVAEMSGTTAGLGYRLYQAQLFSQADRLIACLIVLGVLGALVDTAIAAATTPITRWAAEEH